MRNQRGRVRQIVPSSPSIERLGVEVSSTEGRLSQRYASPHPPISISDEGPREGPFFYFLITADLFHPSDMYWILISARLGRATDGFNGLFFTACRPDVPFNTFEAGKSSRVIGV